MNKTTLTYIVLKAEKPIDALIKLDSVRPFKSFFLPFLNEHSLERRHVASFSKPLVWLATHRLTDF